MHYIDGKGHKSELKSNRNYLTNHTKSKLYHHLLMALKVDTHIHTVHIPIKVISKNQTYNVGNSIYIVHV